MPTDIVASPVGQVPSGMAIGPFDWAPLAGIPVWLYVTLMLIGLFIFVNIIWLMRLGKLASVRGWAESIKQMTQDDVQVWIISRVQKLTIECLTIRDNVLSPHDRANIAMWHHNSAMAAIQVGGHKALVVSEDFDQTRDIIGEIALCHNCDEFNMRHEAFKREMDLKYEKGELREKPNIVSPILNYTDYESHGRECLIALNPYGLHIPSFSIFNPTKFRKYFPLGCTSMFFGGELIHDARKLNLRRKAKGFWEVHAVLAAAVVISIFALVVAWLFPMGA